MLSAGQLMEQAGMTAHDYMLMAVDRIDTLFGAGYAEKHPDLVGAFMQTAAIDFLATFGVRWVGEVLSASEKQ